MQRVSNEYRTSMKSPLRERAHILVSFGLVNQAAQANAKIHPGKYAYFLEIIKTSQFTGHLKRTSRR